MKYTIIGAGIGGLTTALAFEQKGIDYEIFEKALDISEVGAGIWLAPNALQILEKLGLLQEIQQKGISIDRITIAKPNLSPISDSYQNNIKKVFGYSSISVHRAELQKLLMNKVPKEKIHLGKEFKNLKHLDNNKTEITFNDSSTITTDYIIGADGINSNIRKLLFPKSKKRYSGQTCWRGIAPISLVKEFQNRAFELWGNQIRFGISQITKNKVYWFAVVLAIENQEDEPSEIHNKLCALFTAFHPIVKELIAATPLDKIIRNDICDLEPLTKWHKGNICLIGDAGHATTPNMGQGGSQAIEDAYFLSKTITNNSDKNIFEPFQKSRQKKVDFIVNQSWTIGKMAHWKYGKGLRNFLIKTTPNIILEKKLIKLYQID